MDAKTFHERYREDVAIPVRLRVRMIRSNDKEQLARGFERLSSESRYRRFFAHKSMLTPEDLRYLTEFDGENHFAIGAFELSESGVEGDIVGVARFVRLADDPAVAEIGIAVVDDQQGFGIGRLLLQRLLAAARERGVQRIRCHLLGHNTQMRKLIKRFFGNVVLAAEGGTLIGDFPIPDTAPAVRSRAPEPLFELLRLVARGSVTIPAMFALATLEDRLRALERGLDALSRSVRSNEAGDTTTG